MAEKLLEASNLNCEEAQILAPFGPTTRITSPSLPEFSVLFFCCMVSGSRAEGSIAIKAV
jgi:hypothetical protein